MGNPQLSTLNSQPLTVLNETLGMSARLAHLPTTCRLLPTLAHFTASAAAWLAVTALWAVVPAVAAAPRGYPAGGALAGQRPRVIVSSDIGGADPDDFQSMVHLLVYADVLDIEGLISSPPGKGRVADILEVLAAYEQDYPQLKRHSQTYPAPASLRGLVKQGATEPAPEEGYGRPTEGSRWIVQRARRSGSPPAGHQCATGVTPVPPASATRPLWILVWGGISDVAQAVHDEPGIKAEIRVYSTGSWNTRNDPAARGYLHQRHRDLWWIESDTAFRGMYQGGRAPTEGGHQAKLGPDGPWGNRSFLDRHVKGHGALGDLLCRKKADLKMGDTPSLLYLLRGDPDDPTREHWGGAFVSTDHGRHYWTDNPAAELREGNYAGAKTVNKWRVDYLGDWQARMDWAVRAPKARPQNRTSRWRAGDLQRGPVLLW